MGQDSGSLIKLGELNRSMSVQLFGRDLEIPMLEQSALHIRLPSPKHLSARWASPYLGVLNSTIDGLSIAAA